jgi:hypothetical protein
MSKTKSEPPEPPSWADVIRMRLIESRFSRNRISEATGVNLAVVSRFLADRKRIRLDTAEALGRLVNLDLRQVQRRVKHDRAS